MERKTLLQMTKDILEMMESDQVASINDTLESQMVHREIRNTYMHLMARQEWPHLKKIAVLEVMGALQPTTLKIPDTVSEISELKYDVSDVGGRLTMKSLIYKSPSDFLNMVQVRDTTQPNVAVVAEYTTIEVPIFTDQDPTYWTSFDNKHIFVDSYNSAKDAIGLVAAKTQAVVTAMPTWTESDSFVPEMPPQLFPLLLYEAAEACMDLHEKDESETIARRALTHKSLLKTRSLRHDGKTKKGYGRR